MTNYSKIPQDCSAETLFPAEVAEEFVERTEPMLYAVQSGGPHGFDVKIPVWATTLDPLEYNIRKPDGTIDHDNYICLCEWVDGSPITFRYRKTELHKYSREGRHV